MIASVGRSFLPSPFEFCVILVFIVRPRHTSDGDECFIDDEGVVSEGQREEGQRCKVRYLDKGS